MIFVTHGVFSYLIQEFCRQGPRCGQSAPYKDILVLSSAPVELLGTELMLNNAASQGQASACRNICL